MNANCETEHPDRNTLSLSEARNLAANDRADWCIVPLGTDLTVGRLEVGDELRVVRIRDHTGKLFRFPSIGEARRFIRLKLGILRTTLLPI